MHHFHVPRWLRNPHLQTLGAAAPLFAPPRSHDARTEALRIPLDDCGPAADGGTFKLHARAWWGEPGSMAVIVVHGIGGSSDSAYVVRAGVALHRAGYHVVRLDLRGAGASIPDAPSLYHAGLSSDLDAVVAYVAADPRVSGVAILGFSGGGSLALKRAGEWAGAPPPQVRAIVSVSAPLDYTRVAPWMDTLARFPYRFHVLRGLSVGARAFARHHPDRAPYRAEDVKRMGSFREYDSTVIVPMHGFKSPEEYWEAASSGPHLPAIEVPTLLLHADDDPMVPGTTVRPWLARASRALESDLTAHGGHIGWVSGFDEPSWIKGWATSKALAFLDRVRERSRAAGRARELEGDRDGA
jgi:predicted alpha/beta-fold hydrolase